MPECIKVESPMTETSFLLNSSPLLLGLVTKNVQHHLVLTINGVDSHIQGFTAGANNASAGANNTRGQRADVLFLDECDYIGSNQISNVLQICNEAPERIKVICASTPSGKHEEYYRWCMNASKKYYVSSQDIQSNEFNGYKVDELPKKDGNGWVQIYAPSNVNKELLKLNPDTGQTYLEDLRDEFSEMRYAQEVMAEFGEEEMGVYQHKFIELAIAEGRRLGWKYLNKWDDEERKTYLRKTQGRCIRCLGVDWDKYAAGTTLVCMEYDPFHKDETGRSIPLFKVLFREEVPRSEFTYTNAENKIIELNREYKFDWIAVDRGYGETQVEELHKYGMLYPRTKLQDKVIGIQFAEKIEVMDPYTKKKDKKPVKPFMVNNSVSLFEKCKIVLDPSDKVLIEQLEEYRIKGISAAGNPIFTDENEHAIDAMNLALLMFEQKYGTLLKKVYSVKPVLIDMSDKRDMGVASREIKAEDITQVIGTSIKGGPFAPSSTKGIIGITNIRKSGQVRRSENMFRRSSWG